MAWYTMTSNQFLELLSKSSAAYQAVQVLIEQLTKYSHKTATVADVEFLVDYCSSRATEAELANYICNNAYLYYFVLALYEKLTISPVVSKNITLNVPIWKQRSHPVLTIQSDDQKSFFTYSIQFSITDPRPTSIAYKTDDFCKLPITVRFVNLGNGKIRSIYLDSFKEFTKEKLLDGLQAIK